MKRCIMQLDPIEIKMDHPFIFAIRANESLFVGSVRDLGAVVHDEL